MSSNDDDFPINSSPAFIPDFNGPKMLPLFPNVSQRSPTLKIQRLAAPICYLLVLHAALFLTSASHAEDKPTLPPLKHATFTSTADGTTQPLLYWAPESAKDKSTPLFVFLHSWSGSYKQSNTKWQQEAMKHGWIYLHPNFRGVNNSPKACGSRFARQDILDAIDFASETFNVDQSRVYLAGVSGGGHMAMLMAGHHSDRFTAVSAWVGITDLAEWYRFHLKDGKPQHYGQMIAASLSGAPGDSAEIDADYRDRSPVFHMHKVGNLPVDIYAGVQDGHVGSVPVRHSIEAFNGIAKAHGNELVTEAEMESLWTERTLKNPKPSDQQKDELLGRKIHLRRTSGKSRVTIFEGGHESVVEAVAPWLLQHVR